MNHDEKWMIIANREKASQITVSFMACAVALWYTGATRKLHDFKVGGNSNFCFGQAL